MGNSKRSLDLNADVGQLNGRSVHDDIAGSFVGNHHEMKTMLDHVMTLTPSDSETW